MELLTQTYMGPAIGMVFGLWLMGRVMRNGVLNWYDLPAENLTLEQIQEQFHELFENKQIKHAQYFLEKAIFIEHSKLYTLMSQFKKQQLSKQEFNLKLEDLFFQHKALMEKKNNLSKEAIINHLIELCSNNKIKQAQEYLIEVLSVTTIEAFSLMKDIKDIYKDRKQVEIRIAQFYKPSETISKDK